MDTDRQINSIIREIELQLKVNGSSYFAKEGFAENGWVIIDFFDVILLSLLMLNKFYQFHYL